jgi:dihydroflavonol-4-reductase
VRPSSPRANLDGLGIEIAEGDMRDIAAVGRAVKGTRYVFHVAADYRLWAPNPDDILRNNIEGTRVVIEAAKAAGAERIVYTSSVATLKPARLGCHADEMVDETMPLAETEAIGTYKRSKVAAERLVESMIASEGLPVVIVNPTAPIGPRDVRPTPTGRIIIEAASGRMPAFVDTGLNLVHVDDVAAGHVAALRHGRIGERYILGGENMTLAEMLGRIARLAGRRPPRLRLPRHLIFPLAYAAEAAAHFTGREPFVTLDGLRMAKSRMFFTSEKAKRELDYKARPADVAVGDAIQWFHEAGYIR